MLFRNPCIKHLYVFIKVIEFDVTDHNLGKSFLKKQIFKVLIKKELDFCISQSLSLKGQNLFDHFSRGNQVYQHKLHTSENTASNPDISQQWEMYTGKSIQLPYMSHTISIQSFLVHIVHVELVQCIVQFAVFLRTKNMLF